MKRNKKRVLSGITAVCCAAAVLLVGTFAWQAVSSAVNEFSDRQRSNPKDPGGNLHDDFDSSTGDKKIYVENTGDTDIYVRVKLQEILGLGSETKPAGSQWETHMPANGNVADGDEGYHDAIDDAFTWTMGNTAPYSFKSIVGAAEWSSGTIAGDIEGSRKNTDKLVGDALGSAQSGSTIVDLGSAATANKQAPAAQVVTMEAYKAMNATAKESFAGWVYDVDGYAYWSQPLAAGAATGLLLNGVTIPGAESETYYYAINAIMEYVDMDDLAAWTSAGTDGKREITLNGKGQMASDKNAQGAVIKEGSQTGQTTIEASDDAKDMLLTIANASLRAEGATTLLNKGETAPPPTVKDADGKTVTVTWSSSNESIVSVDPDTGVITGVEVGGPVTVTGTDQNGSEVTYQVSVKAKDPADLTAVDPPANLNVGDQEDAPIVKDGNGNEADIVEWESSDPDVATVDPDTGEITAVGPGETTITGKDKDGNEVIFDVTVTDLFTATPSAVTVKAGEEVAIPVITNAKGETVSAADLTWVSADGSKVTVNAAAGKINGVSASGTAVKITGTDASGNRVEILVTVTAADKSAEDKLNEAVLEEYFAAEDAEESIKLGSDNGVIVPAYSNNMADNAINPGDFSKNYGVVSLSKLLTNSQYAQNVTFTSTDSKVVKIENGNVYLWYLPTTQEMIDNGLNDGYRPPAVLTATYTDPDTNETASKEVSVCLYFDVSVDL